MSKATQSKEKKVWRISHIVKEFSSMYGTSAFMDEWAYLYTDDGEVKKVKVQISYHLPKKSLSSTKKK